MLSNQVVKSFRAYMRARTGPKGAYDALPHPKSPPLRIADFERGGAFDAEETAMPDPADVPGLAAWVKKNLSLDQQGELIAHLTSGASETPATAADDSRRRALARDARAPSRPTEAQREAFAKRFPEAAAVRHV